jgi:hypothetical protein
MFVGRGLLRSSIKITYSLLCSAIPSLLFESVTLITGIWYTKLVQAIWKVSLVYHRFGFDKLQPSYTQRCSHAPVTTEPTTKSISQDIVKQASKMSPIHCLPEKKLQFERVYIFPPYNKSKTSSRADNASHLSWRGAGAWRRLSCRWCLRALLFVRWFDFSLCNSTYFKILGSRYAACNGQISFEAHPCV